VLFVPWSLILWGRTLIQVEIGTWRRRPTADYLLEGFGFMLGGSIVIETIFNLKGIGWLSYDALLRSDLPVVQAIVLIFASLYGVLTLRADRLNAYLDPRISVR